MPTRQIAPGVSTLAGVEALVEASHGDPYLRAALPRGGTDITGWTRDGAVVWCCEPPARRRRHHRSGGPLAAGGGGEPVALADLACDVLADPDMLPPGSWLSFPRAAAVGFDGVISYGAGYGEWEFRWAHVPLPVAPGEAGVEFLSADAAEVEDFLDRAYPDAETRPGDGHVVGWAVLRDGAGRIVACAADTSSGAPNPMGHVAAIATDPAMRGRGLGGAVTAALTRRLLRDVDTVSLGMYLGNDAARRTYARIGFDGSLIVRSGVRA